jgi:hypothetical protein
MPTLYKIDPERLPRYTNTVELGGRNWRIVWRWNNRTRGWYIDVYDSDEALVIAGERLSVGGILAFGSVTFAYVFVPAGNDTFATWEDWADGKLTLYYIE